MSDEIMCLSLNFFVCVCVLLFSSMEVTRSDISFLKL